MTEKKRIAGHDCRKHQRSHTATQENLYHFLDSGLPNVYLAGVKYWTCDECKSQWAEIPAPEQLMNVIAESIVLKPGLLSGSEIKFLRKRVGKRAADFAELISKTPEHFSKLETESLKLQPATDKLIRLIYGMLSGDKQLLNTLYRTTEKWLRSIHGKRDQPIKIKQHDDTWVPMAA